MTPVSTTRISVCLLISCDLTITFDSMCFFIHPRQISIYDLFTLCWRVFTRASEIRHQTTVDTSQFKRSRARVNSAIQSTPDFSDSLRCCLGRATNQTTVTSSQRNNWIFYSRRKSLMEFFTNSLKLFISNFLVSSTAPNFFDHWRWSWTVHWTEPFLNHVKQTSSFNLSLPSSVKLTLFSMQLAERFNLFRVGLSA